MSTKPDIGADDFERTPDDAYADDELPVIRIRAGQLHNSADAAEAVMAPDVYLRGGALVRLGKAVELPKALGIVRHDCQSVMVAVNVDYLRRELTRRARFQRYDARGKKWFGMDCPTSLATNIANVAESRHWRPLTAIARAPFLRPDFSVCETAGYDAATGIYYEPSQAFPPIPQSPTKEHAQAALNVLRAPFDEFPFAKTSAAESVFIAHILTAVVRATLPTSPVLVYSAPSAAHGKTLLCEVASLIATGNLPAVRPYASQEEERRKVLLGSLLAGDASLLIDNVPNGAKFRSSVLCAFATASVYGDRKLGESDSTSLVNTLLVSVTGNNITPCGDLARRALVCRLDINAESARGRTFRIANLKDHVSEHRAELLVAALTIIKAYAVAGAPKIEGVRAIESFESWAHAIRDPLVWLGMADPVETQETETDDEGDALQEAFAAIEALYGTGEFTAKQITGEMGVVAADLRAALGAAGCRDANDANSIGHWLRSNRDRVTGGFKLINRDDKHKKTAVWRLKEK
jgi:putative DNA primase/helicase